MDRRVPVLPTEEAQLQLSKQEKEAVATAACSEERRRKWGKRAYSLRRYLHVDTLIWAAELGLINRFDAGGPQTIRALHACMLSTGQGREYYEAG